MPWETVSLVALSFATLAVPAFSTDILGLVVEKVTGKRLNDYLKSAVWEKVRMLDTSFQVPPEKRNRLARPLARDPIDGKDQKIAILDEPVKFDCAGSCAFGTVADYLRFGQMLLNGGSIDGRRVLSPKTGCRSHQRRRRA